MEAKRKVRFELTLTLEELNLITSCLYNSKKPAAHDLADELEGLPERNSE